MVIIVYLTLLGYIQNIKEQNYMQKIHLNNITKRTVSPLIETRSTPLNSLTVKDYSYTKIIKIINI